MDANELDQIEPETEEATETTESTQSSPFQQICPRHGEKVHLYHGCPKCVMEEVRRHERRIVLQFEQEPPMAADSVDPAQEQAA